MNTTDSTITLDLHHTLTTAVAPSRRVCEVAAMFGLGVDESKTLEIIPPTKLTLTPGSVVFITGASGGGKTTLLRCVRNQFASDDRANIIDFDECAVDDDSERALVDALGDDLEEAAACLSLAGLNDAHVMLRRPDELSDGQRYRWRLARSIHAARQINPPPLRERLGEGESLNIQAAGSTQVALDDKTLTPALSLQGRGGLTLVLTDEFGATLDRLTARIIARNVRKWTRRSGVCFLAATTHDDLLEPLEPDVLVVQHPGRGMEVLERNDQTL